MKKIATICLGMLLSTQALLAADFSKYSLEDLKKLAGKVDPKDALDYRLEINKRMEDMTVKEARAFKEELRQARTQNQSNMTQEQIKQYRNNVHEQSQKQIDNMTVKEAKSKGVFNIYSGMGHRDGHHKDQNRCKDQKHSKHQNAH